MVSYIKETFTSIPAEFKHVTSGEASGRDIGKFAVKMLAGVALAFAAVAAWKGMLVIVAVAGLVTLGLAIFRAKFPPTDAGVEPMGECLGRDGMATCGTCGICIENAAKKKDTPFVSTLNNDDLPIDPYLNNVRRNDSASSSPRSKDSKDNHSEDDDVDFWNVDATTITSGNGKLQFNDIANPFDQNALTKLVENK